MKQRWIFLTLNLNEKYLYRLVSIFYSLIKKIIMKKTLTIAAMLAVWTLVLTGCNKTKNVEEIIDETPIVDSDNSLDLGELISLIENNFPKAYDYSITNISTNENEKGTHVYKADEIGFLTPEYSNIVDREVVSSGIQDGMIYTTVKATLDDEKEIDVLYIVDPATRNFVAANIEDGDIFTNYQFSYFVDSLTYSDLEEIAKYNFPEYSSSTFVNLETEETIPGENIYSEDTPHNLTNITPDFPHVAQQELLSSGIEDWMIYSNFNVTFDDWTTGNILYINNPQSLRFVAATVDSEWVSINYQFS